MWLHRHEHMQLRTRSLVSRWPPAVDLHEMPDSRDAWAGAGASASAAWPASAGPAEAAWLTGPCLETGFRWRAIFKLGYGENLIFRTSKILSCWAGPAGLAYQARPGSPFS